LTDNKKKKINNLEKRNAEKCRLATSSDMEEIVRGLNIDNTVVKELATSPRDVSAWWSLPQLR